MIYTNFVHGVPEDILAELAGQLTPRQRELAFPFLEKVPMGVLIILGPAGSGKSWMLGFTILLLIASGLTVSVIGSSNVAVINISDKTSRMDRRNRLLLRPWQLFEEESAVMRYVPDSDDEEWKEVDPNDA